MLLLLLLLCKQRKAPDPSSTFIAVVHTPPLPPPPPPLPPTHVWRRLQVAPAQVGGPARRGGQLLRGGPTVRPVVGLLRGDTVVTVAAAAATTAPRLVRANQGIAEAPTTTEGVVEVLSALLEGRGGGGFVVRVEPITVASVMARVRGRLPPPGPTRDRTPRPSVGGWPKEHPDRVAGRDRDRRPPPPQGWWRW